jgi:hypothetical protein
MSNLPSGIGAFSPGGYSLPANLKLPPAGYNYLAGLPLAAGSSPAPAPMVRPGTRTAPYGPFDVTAPLAQTFGIGSQFNPMTVFDLMNLGLGPFVSPFAGSGLQGYPSAPFTRGLSAAAGPAVSGALAAATPVPRSGGKGVMG